MGCETKHSGSSRVCRRLRTTRVDCFRLLPRTLKRLWTELAILLHKNFNLAFRRFQFLAAGIGELHSLLKQRHGTFERKLTFFEFAYDLLQSLEALFKLRQNRNSSAYFSPGRATVQTNFCASWIKRNCTSYCANSYELACSAA